MDNKTQSFMAIVFDEDVLKAGTGAFNTLCKSVGEIKSILECFKPTFDLTHKQKLRLYDYGVSAEFSAGISMPLAYAHSRRPSIEKHMRQFFEAFAAPSELSQAAPKEVGIDFKNETSGQAIPRAIQDLRDFVTATRKIPTKSREIYDNELDRLERHTTDCEDAYLNITAFVDKYAAKIHNLREYV